MGEHRDRRRLGFFQTRFSGLEEKEFAQRAGKEIPAQTSDNSNNPDKNQREQAKQMGDQVNAIVYQAINKELRPNGLLREAIKTGR